MMYMLEFPDKSNNQNETTVNKDVNAKPSTQPNEIDKNDSLPSAPIYNIGICTTTTPDLANRIYRAEIYLNSKCVTLASSNRFDYDTLDMLAKEIIAKNISSIKDICNKHDIYICYLRFNSRKTVLNIVDNYCGIPLHNHFTLENANITGLFGKASIKGMNCIFCLKHCNINSELSLCTKSINFSGCNFKDGISVNLECKNNALIKNCTLPKDENMSIEITGYSSSLAFLSDKKLYPNTGGSFDIRRFYARKDKIIFYEKENIKFNDLENDNELRGKQHTAFGNVFDTNIPYTGFARKSQIAIGFDIKRKLFSYGYSLDVNLKNEILVINSNEKLEFEDRKKLYIALENNDEKTTEKLCDKFDLKISCLKFKERQVIKKIQDDYRGIPLDSRFKIINAKFTEKSNLNCFNSDILLQNCEDIGLASLNCKAIKSII